VKEISRLPDPERASHNIESFLSEHPDMKERVEANLEYVAALFSHSQFLANYCNIHPAALFNAIDSMNKTPGREELAAELRTSIQACGTTGEGMRVIRNFRKDRQLSVTLKDILGLADLQDIMLEMSDLADVILSESLTYLTIQLDQRYGSPIDNSLSMIALGKLGAQELNYSSDVDIVFVFRQDGETTGVESIPGMMINRVSAGEYYVKLVEEFTRFVSSNTEDGFAYRVDLRLRPEGQRGSLALSLRGYEDYYESWGQLWEKAALLRARHIAGDGSLGNDFIKAITPFIYRKYLDLETIDEIRKMKLQVEQLKSGTFSRDLKRGYGGIREIEFFIQVFQLMYGGKEPMLRERSTLKALHRLAQKGLVGYDDMGPMSENYVFLRNVEHRIQQLNDLQTHSLPSGDRELDILGRKMGFSGRKDFLADLGKRRKKVRSVYDSLFQSQTRANEARDDEGVLMGRIFWDVETPIKQPLEDELALRGVREIGKAIHYLMQIRNNIYSFQTIRGRRLLSDIVPKFVEKALQGDNPVAALLQLVGFSRLLAANESYIETIGQRPELVERFNFVFSHSDYLSKVLMSNPEYMESLILISVKKKKLDTLVRDLELLIERKGETAAIRVFRRLEEIRLGNLMLAGEIDIAELMRGISLVAEAVFCSLSGRHASRLMVAGFGKLGGREIIFNSDLDIVLVTLNDPETGDVKDAENLLKILMSYTKDGVAYKVDTRLRPDGSKGTLVSSISGISDYYLMSAAPWELQALLKARPVSGDSIAKRSFLRMRRNVLLKRAGEITIDEIRNMRERIKRELSKDAASSGQYDIKQGAGGLAELEFAIQYLQLKNCARFPRVAVQGTLEAITRLRHADVISARRAEVLRDTYLFYRTIETVLRLRSENILKVGSDAANSAAQLTGFNEDELIRILEQARREISRFMEDLAR
jgi:glutamate-ammonia-ligase adenylyltransferase